LSQSALWRTERFRQQLPTYVIFAAIGVAIVVLSVKHHAVNEQTIVFFATFIPAVILHEVSHGVVAYWCGDDTAKAAGRLTLNPLKHVDPFGSIVLPFVLAVTGAPIFGWAKPVPVSLSRLRHPRNQAVLVGLVGPVTNIVLAAITGLAFHLANNHFQVQAMLIPPNVDPISVWPLIMQVLFYFGIVNIILAVFNLIPIPPLDGSALLERLLPVSMLDGYYRIRSFLIVIVLFFVLFDRGVLSNFLGNVEQWYFLRII
jgi:Zn-dependent protease